MKAADQKKRKAHTDNAQNEQDKHRRDDGEFDRGRAFLVPMDRS
jgi:hypothetical protein